MNLSNQDVQLAQQMFVSSATQVHPLGTRGSTPDGRVYRYARAGAVDLVAGNVIQAAAIVTNFLANTPPIVGIGAQSFVYTPGASTAVANAYAEGYLQVDTTPGNGYTYTIQSSPAIASATAFTLPLMFDESIQIALTASSRVGIIQNLYADVVQAPVTTATGCQVGVAAYIIKATQYGWIQTWGPCSVLINGTPALGAGVVSPSATTAGAVDVITTTNLVTAALIGYMMQVGVSTKNNFVNLKISP